MVSSKLFKPCLQFNRRVLVSRNFQLKRKYSKKLWGDKEYFGLANTFDLHFAIPKRTQAIEKDLIKLCHDKLRANATEYDKTSQFPRENMEELAKKGYLSLLVPQELGGRGESLITAAIAVETIARYGCASTALVYAMHLCATAALLSRHKNNPQIQKLLSNLDKECIIGAVSYSDPSTGGHRWYPLNSKVERTKEGWKISKKSSFTTSAGFADFYIIHTTSPNFKNDFSDTSCFLLKKEEVMADKDWDAMSLRGNQSGPLVIDTIIPFDRLIGDIGEGRFITEEILDPIFLLLTSSCWNGISMGSIDIVKLNSKKVHADDSKRICDYPTIQDIIGEAISSTNASRSMVYSIARGMDEESNECDWMNGVKLSKFKFPLFQCKFISAKNASKVTDDMLHAMGGDGLKRQFELERYLRDSKAGWVMGPSNEVVRQLIGKAALLGEESIDLWNQRVDNILLHSEIDKLTNEEKNELIKKIKISMENENTDKIGEMLNLKKDFMNPFHTAPIGILPPFYQNGILHKPGIDNKKFTKLRLEKITEINPITKVFKFALPNKEDHFGCFVGQYLTVRAKLDNGKEIIRYYSPISDPYKFGSIELLIKMREKGEISNYFNKMKEGDWLEFMGPSGGFEYHPNTLDEVLFIVFKSGITPALQFLRNIFHNKEDETKIKILYAADTPDQIYFKEEMDEYVRMNKNFKIYYTITGVDSSKKWNENKGPITKEVIQSQFGNPKGRFKIILCGDISNLTNQIRHLYELNYPSQSIFVFGYTGDELVRSVYGKHAPLSSHTSKFL